MLYQNLENKYLILTTILLCTKKTVIALTKKLVTATSTEQKNSIHHNIIKTKKKIVTLSKKIRNLNSVINNLLITKRTYKKRKLVKIE